MWIDRVEQFKLILYFRWKNILRHTNPHTLSLDTSFCDLDIYICVINEYEHNFFFKALLSNQKEVKSAIQILIEIKGLVVDGKKL